MPTDESGVLYITCLHLQGYWDTEAQLTKGYITQTRLSVFA